MPSYTTMTQGGRVRLLRTDHATSTATAVTTLAANNGTQIADALTTVVADIPSKYVYYVLEHAGPARDSFPDLDPHGYEQSNQATDWFDVPAPTKPFSLRRRVLNVLDGHDDRDLPGVTALRNAVAGQPESVRRAVRDEVSALFEPYDGVPVIARFYDWKWNDCNSVVLAAGALAAMRPEVLDRVRPDDALDIARTIEALALDDLSFAQDTWEQGYLSVQVHAAQLDAWKAARSNA